eukprot:EG_transcript_13668
MAFLNQMLLNKTRREEPTAEYLEKMRRLEEERKIRIFDPKARVIGVDKTALDAQVEEKARLTQLDADRDEFYATQALAMDQHALFLASQRDAEAALLAKDLEAYRQRFQKKHAAREWDLNDPKRVITDLPARIGDADPRCGAASLQQFYGEDLEGSERRRRQQDQQLKWVQMQQDEKNLMRWLEQERDRKYAERQNEISDRSWEINAEAEYQRKLKTRATAEFNGALARQRQEQQRAAKEQDMLDSLEEVRNALDSDMLTENPRATKNATNPTRFRPDNMKGFSPEQQIAILNAQAAQRDELMARREREAEDEQRWALQDAKVHALACAMDEEKARLRRLAREELQQDHRVQVGMADQRRRQERSGYRPDIGDEWWGKFNTVTR